MSRQSNAWVMALLFVAVAWTAPLRAQEMTLNLKDADLGAVIATVSKMTGKNFIIDPRVKGKVTIISSHPMSAEETYEVFLSVLNVHGFAAIPGKNVIKIVPEVNAKQDAIPTVSGREGTEDDQYVTRVIQVENVAAAQLVPILRPLLPQDGHLAAYPSSNVLIASGLAANIARLVAIIARIDQTGDSEIELIPLRHASAEEVVRILTSLDQSTARGQAAPQGQSKVLADVRTNSVLIGGERADRLRLKVIISHLDTPLETSGNTQVIYLRYAKAADLASVLSGVGTGIQEKGAKAAAVPANAQGQISIQADESTNALVITAPPDVMRDLESVIRKLDIRRAQVMVKAVIAEVSEEKANEIGVMWGYDGSSDSQPVGIVNFGSMGVAGLAADVPVVPEGLTLGIGDTGGAFRIGAIIRALGGDADSNILATPSLVTMDNEEANIVVGQTVPFITGSYTTTANSSTNPFQTIQREDVGLTLKITPQINEGDAIKLDLEQEVSSVIPSTQAGLQSTNKRSIKTSVMVDDGEILVLGGLIDDTLRETEQRVPGLGNVPVLGWLFRYQKTEKVKRNLMIFLHPTIIRGGKQGTVVSTEKYNYLRAEQFKFRERGVRLLDDESSPMLPELQDFLELPPPFDESERAPVQGVDDGANGSDAS